MDKKDDLKKVVEEARGIVKTKKIEIDMMQKPTKKIDLIESKPDLKQIMQAQLQTEYERA